MREAYIYTVLVDGEAIRKFKYKEDVERFCENRKDVEIVRERKPKPPSIIDVLNDIDKMFGPAPF
jgi:hypothetical protein